MGLLIRFIVILMAISQPMIILLVCGNETPSISSAWSSVLQPLYIVTNAATSFFFFDIHKWKIPAILLLLLTAFSVEFSLITHNIIAGLFFLSCLYPLYWVRRVQYYLVIYLISIIVWSLYGMYWFEVWAIYTLCGYHIHLLIHKINIDKVKKNN